MKCNLFAGPLSHLRQFNWDCSILKLLDAECKFLVKKMFTLCVDLFMALVISIGYDDAVYQTG